MLRFVCLFFVNFCISVHAYPVVEDCCERPHRQAPSVLKVCLQCTDIEAACKNKEDLAEKKYVTIFYDVDGDKEKQKTNFEVVGKALQSIPVESLQLRYKPKKIEGEYALPYAQHDRRSPTMQLSLSHHSIQTLYSDNWADLYLEKLPQLHTLIFEGIEEEKGAIHVNCSLDHLPNLKKIILGRYNVETRRAPTEEQLEVVRLLFPDMFLEKPLRNLDVSRKQWEERIIAVLISMDRFLEQHVRFFWPELANFAYRVGDHIVGPLITACLDYFFRESRIDMAAFLDDAHYVLTPRDGISLFFNRVRRCLNPVHWLQAFWH